MAGGGGLAQQVAEKLADLIQVSLNIEKWTLASQCIKYYKYCQEGHQHLSLCFRVKYTQVAVEKVLLEAHAVGGWLGVR